MRFTDLLPATPADGKTYDYAQESGNLLTAAETTHGSVKPQADATYEDASAPLPTIAHWIKVQRQQLADQAELEARLRDRLAYGVEWRFEAQAIAGNGVGENIRGILNTTGLGHVAFVAGTFGGDAILDGIGDVLLSGAEPNVVALAVRDWTALMKAKASGSGEYLSAGAFAQAASILWGVDIVPVPGLPQGSALVGDTRLGARALIREGVSVVAGQEADDLTRNLVTLLGEARLGLAVDQPSAWVEVALA